MNSSETKKLVKEGYGRIAKKGGLLTQKGCCGPKAVSKEDIAKTIGYTETELSQIPDDANMGLGCGNPLALSSIKKGDTVLDLGSGAGIDCFLASKIVGSEGRVIGVDMTPDMIEKAKNNAQKGNFTNVEFRLGEIEHLPVEDNSVDLIISNCVINLSPDKPAVFQEAFRVLKPGGTMVVSDIVTAKNLPEELRKSVQGYIGCVSGAETKEKYISAIEKAGFKKVKIINEKKFSREIINSFLKSLGIENYSDDMDDLASSIKVEAVK